MGEVAGLVLGILPLVVSAADQYKECFQFLKRMRDFRFEYRKCKNRLVNLDIDYDLTLEQLFADVVENSEEKERLKSSANDEGWDDVEAKLKERLNPTLYKAYVATMRDFKESMEELFDVLGLNNQMFQRRLVQGRADSPQRISAVGQNVHTTRPAWCSKSITIANASQSWITFEFQRMTFSLNKRRREELFNAVESYVNTLDRLLRKSDIVAKLGQGNQNTVSIPQGLLEFWRHAQKVYSLLSLSWKCSCMPKHCADLCLLHREASSVRFDIYFRSSDQYSSCSQVSWICHKAIVAEPEGQGRPSPSAIKGKTVRNFISSDQTHATSGANVPPKAAAKYFGRNTRIDSSTPASSAPQSCAVASGSGRTHSLSNTSISSSAVSTSGKQTSLGPMTARKTSDVIENLCEAISKHCDSRPCTGLLVDPNNDSTYCILPSNVNRHYDGTTVSLHSLLTNVATKPNRTQRYGIALAIASSHLQLHSSSWLGAQWSSKEIFFDIVDGNALISDPRLRRRFATNLPARNISSVDETFTTLGILLLELCFGVTLEQSPFRSKYMCPDGEKDPLMDLAAAQAWAELVEGEAGPEYADAVDWCLSMRRLRASHSSWKNDLHMVVIEPIRLSYLNLTSRNV